MKKNLSSSRKKNSAVKKKNSYKEFYFFKLGVKVLLIFMVLYYFYYSNQYFSNSVNLLAVSIDEDGKAVGGSTVKLDLKIKKGTGQTYVNLNTIREVDTQISIINSKKAACLIFKLDCSKYDFYFDFKGSAFVLKGPSASSAIAILTAKTIRGIKIDKNTAITGTLSSGGLIGSVGGIEEKIKIAKNVGIKKVLVPYFSEFNKTEGVEVVPVLDIVEAYNKFNDGDNYFINKKIVPSESYLKIMKKLSGLMCKRSNELKSSINFTRIKFYNKLENISNYSLDLNSNVSANNGVFSEFLNSAFKSLNSSEGAIENSNYYSAGSFCYNSNINFRIVVELLKNNSIDDLNMSILVLNKKIKDKKNFLKNYLNEISSLNDFYVALLLFDRLDESENYLKEAKKVIEEINLMNINLNQSKNLTNVSNKFDYNKEFENKKRMATILYSQAEERFYTVELWQLFITKQKSKYSFDELKLSKACERINKDITIKSKFLKSENVNVFEESVKEQNKLLNLGNYYLCIYKGLEILGKMDTIANSVQIKQNNSKKYVEKMIDFTKRRIGLNSKGDFPFIPYIYSEYAEDLFKTQNYFSAILYSNYALSYSDLNLYIEEEKVIKKKAKEIYYKLFENPLFLLGILLLIGFV